jgi:hypothetical protein
VVAPRVDTADGPGYVEHVFDPKDYDEVGAPSTATQVLPVVSG